MNTLNVADTLIRIRWEAQGRYYCLNDFHKAAVTAGANKRSKEPGEFFKATRTKALLCLLEQEGGATGNPRSFGEGAYGESPYAPPAKLPQSSSSMTVWTTAPTSVSNWPLPTASSSARRLT